MRIALANHDVQVVYRLLQRFGMTQQAIARATGQSQGEVSEITTGRRQVQGYDMFVRLAEGFRLPLGWLGLGYDAETIALLAASESAAHGRAVREADRAAWLAPRKPAGKASVSQQKVSRKPGNGQQRTPPPDKK